MKSYLQFSLCTILISLFIYTSTDGQVYMNKQTRHRFAQMTMGIDMQASIGGKTSFVNGSGNVESLDLPTTAYPRFIIGGTHFWGHADFYIAIPLLSPEFSISNQKLQYITGVETVFKYYPWKIERKKIRPYVGTIIAPYYYYQDNGYFENGRGARRHMTRLPLTGGITYNSKNHLFELGISYNYDNKSDYYISPEQKIQLETPPMYVSLSYKYMLETTLSAERDWENGTTPELYQTLKSNNKLNGFFVGVGLSSAWWLRSNEYVEDEHPYTSGFGTNIMFDWTAGYYWGKPDMDISLNYRGYKASSTTYELYQQASRRSVTLELKKYFYDYHGFTPFVGPLVSYEQLSYQNTFNGGSPDELSSNTIAYGVTFGWDIRPTKMDSWLLRTNLRYFPNLNLAGNEGKSFSFDNVEFNFIQFIMYPGRMF